jgi:ABC-type branched-subunit amino acid transport system permease subunit
MQNVVYGTPAMFGKEISVAGPRLDLWFLDGSTDRGLFYITLIITLVCCAAVVLIDRSRLGRLLRALSESPTTLVTSGLGVTVTRVLVFCVSAFFAAVAGALFLSQAGQLGRDVGFGPFESLTWLAVTAITGRRLLASPFVAAALLTLGPSYFSSLTPEWQTTLFGFAAVAAALIGSGTDWSGMFARLAAASAHRSRISPVRWRTSRASTGAEPVAAGVSS